MVDMTNKQWEAIAEAVNETIGGELINLTDEVVSDVEDVVENAIRSISNDVTEAVRDALEKAFDGRRSFNVTEQVYEELAKLRDVEREPSTESLAKLNELVDAIIFATCPTIGFFETATRLTALRQEAMTLKNKTTQS